MEVYKRRLDIWYSWVADEEQKKRSYVLFMVVYE